MIAPCGQDRLGRAARGPRRPATAAVEFAVVLALFLAIFIYGFLEISRAVMVVQVLTNAARAGCRQGAQSGSTNSDVTTAVDAVMQANNLTTYEPVAITVSDPSTPSNTTDVSSASSGSLISVQVSIKGTNFSWWGSSPFLRSNGQTSIIYSHKLTMRKQ